MWTALGLSPSLPPSLPPTFPLSPSLSSHQVEPMGACLDWQHQRSGPLFSSKRLQSELRSLLALHPRVAFLVQGVETVRNDGRLREDLKTAHARLEARNYRKADRCFTRESSKCDHLLKEKRKATGLPQFVFAQSGMLQTETRQKIAHEIHRDAFRCILDRDRDLLGTRHGATLDPSTTPLNPYRQMWAARRPMAGRVGTQQST